MGETSGHVSLGLAFLIIGVWHLFNTIKLHSLNPRSYHISPWFPLSRPSLKYLEPVAIMLVTTVFVSMELVFNRKQPIILFIASPYQPIPSKNLPHLEHSIIALSFFFYALFAILLDKFSRVDPVQNGSTRNGLAHFLQAVAFGQQLLILHLHSTDHTGVEGQYHWLLQIVTFVTLIATLLSIGYARSFLVSFVRAFSVILEGVWLVVTGVMLWTEKLMPEGCFMSAEMGREGVVCGGDGAALERAKALVNIEFGLYLILLTVFTMCLYLVLVKLYPRETAEYRKLTKLCDQEEEGDDQIILKPHQLCI
ncbi:hypothetical protein ABFS82_14G169500 [Erythranthe guttata]|uniref:Uncharacterized protein n=1 Tax=Erythranthe guttata TaxID=4155 RepID=A0A022RSN2_ERYGU|nr:PREDICTED: uncharacterized protein LOC105951739 [Erythranthe guttata]EYU42981.1 hypothetical protein MIMGU_mgv1a010569mg [Erythranthe guttata]|eukprot:XP_012830644.1 PREDICTED: uncharacterized protein LOC105951739 [Erythranthe guttata]